jgi:molybdopterin converting factor small subunit
MVTVKIVGSRKIEIDLEDGATVKDLFGKIFLDRPKVLDRFLNPQTKEVHPYVSVWLNNRSIKESQGFQTKLKTGDVVMIFLPSAGG